MRIWAAMVAAVRVSRPQNVCAVAGQFHLVAIRSGASSLARGGTSDIARHRNRIRARPVLPPGLVRAASRAAPGAWSTPVGSGWWSFTPSTPC